MYEIGLIEKGPNYEKVNIRIANFFFYYDNFLKFKARDCYKQATELGE